MRLWLSCPHPTRMSATVIVTDIGATTIDMGTDMVAGGVLWTIRTAVTRLRGIVLRDHARGPILPNTEGIVITEVAIPHIPQVTLAMIHAADLLRRIDTRRTLADPGALVVIPVVATDLQVGTSLEIMTHPVLPLSPLAQNLAPILFQVLRLSSFHHAPVHLQNLVDQLW